MYYPTYYPHRHNYIEEPPQEEPPHKGRATEDCNIQCKNIIKDEHVQELEDELKENSMKWDVIGLGEVRRKEGSFTTLQSGHLLYHSEANNGQAGVGFLINKKWKDNITRVSSGSSTVAELILRITDIYQLKIVPVYAPTTSHSDEWTYNFYNTIDNILEKQTHYTIVMGDFNAKVGRTNKHIKKGDRMLRPGSAKWKRRHSCRMGNIKEFQDHEHIISEESREEMDVDKPWWKH